MRLDGPARSQVGSDAPIRVALDPSVIECAVERAAVAAGSGYVQRQRIDGEFSSTSHSGASARFSPDAVRQPWRRLGFSPCRADKRVMARS
jgi:hypothetical protein